jgi:sodium transport system permease protein
MAIDIHTVKLIYLKELREIARDKKIIFLAVIIPILIYPFVFFGINKLFSIQESKMKDKGLRYAVIGEVSRIAPYLSNKDKEYQISFVSADNPSEALETLDADLTIEIRETDSSGRTEFWLFYDGSDDQSIMAMREVTDQLAASEPDWIRDQLINMNIDVQNATPVEIAVKDISSTEARSGHLIGKILPFILVLMLISGCSFTAVDLIAGEKERGCFETILVTSIARHDLILGKFLVVLTSGLLSAFLNILGMVATLKLGFFQGKGGLDFTFDLSFMTFLGVILCTIPLGILFASVLMVFSAKARSFQEGQLYLMPFSLLAIIPTLVVALPDISSDSFVLLVPIANVAVVLREFLEQSIKIPYMILANLINLIYSGFVLKWAVGFMENEGTLVGSPASLTTQKSRRISEIRASLLTFIIVWLMMYFVLGPLQQWNLTIGMLLTFYVLILGAAFLHTKTLKLSFKETFSLRSTPVTAWLAVPFFTVGMLLFTNWLSYYQMQVLPFPESLGEVFKDVFHSKDMSIWLSIFLFSISPGLCEEVLFRGAIMGTLRRRYKPVKYILWSSLLFGFLHFSVYRFALTTLLGIGFGYMTFRSRSIYPAMVSHALNNYLAIHVLSEMDLPEDLSIHWYLFGIPLVLIGILLFERSHSRADDEAYGRIQ